MKTINLSQDLTISRIIHGMMRLNAWDLNAQGILSLIKKDLELGINTFDHADIYGNYGVEATFGKAIELEPRVRSDIKLISKCGIQLMSHKFPNRKVKHYDTSYEHIIESVENSLKNLHTDYLDLLLIHRPNPFMNPEEVAKAFHDLKREGKVLHFGVSNFNASQFETLQVAVDVPLVTNQVEISLMNPSYFTNGTMDHCFRNNIIPMAWSPLGGGRFFQTTDERIKGIKTKLNEIKDRYNLESIDTVIYAWLLMHPSKIYPIVGSSQIERLKHAIRGLNVNLSTEEWFEIYSVATGKDVD